MSLVITLLLTYVFNAQCRLLQDLPDEGIAHRGRRYFQFWKMTKRKNGRHVVERVLVVIPDFDRDSVEVDDVPGLRSRLAEWTGQFNCCGAVK